MRIVIITVAIFLITSCSGLLWNGPSPRNSEDTSNITITIGDPSWDSYFEWLEEEKTWKTK